jgi:hypothetical protein
MATILDLGLLQSFDIIFPVILIFALVFAILQKTKVVGDSLGINSIIAVAVAFMSLLSESVIQVVKFIIPWFTVAIIFFLLIILVFQVFGAKEADIFSYVKGDKAIGWVVIGVGIVIIFAAFANVLGQQLTDASFQSSSGGNVTIITPSEGVATENFQQNIYSTLFHPKVLGLLVLFGIAIFAVALLTGPAT